MLIARPFSHRAGTANKKWSSRIRGECDENFRRGCAKVLFRCSGSSTSTALMMGLFGANDWFADCETVVKSSVVLR
jgi:hypothetical protein